MARPIASTRLRAEPLEDRTAPAAGDLDPTFGDGGKVVITPTTGVDPLGLEPSEVAVQPDGRIVVAGDTPGGAVWAARFTADGQPDQTFGVGGLAYLGLGAPSQVAGVAVQPDGRVVLAGAEAGPTPVDSSLSNSNFFAIRLTADGQLDPTFDGDGKVTVSFPVGSFDQASARAVAVRPDGAIVLAGGVVTNSGLRQFGNPHIPPVTVYFEDFAAVRLTADGRLDAGFGDAGRVRIPFDLGADNTEAALAVGVRPDGWVVLAGEATDYGGNAIGYAAARLTADGQLDPTFDGDGKASGPAVLIDSALVQPDGRVVFAGTEVLLTTADGPLDPGFGSDGRVPTPFYDPLDAVSFRPQGLAVQPDGNILLAGRRQTEGLVVRLVGNGPIGPVVPWSVLVGGRPDGTAVVLVPADGRYTLGSSFTFFPEFAGSVRTAVADVTGDGVPDYVGGAGPGGGPRVAVIDGATGERVADWFAFEATFTGGVFVAAGDLDGDGKAEVVVTPDRGGGPVVAVYSGAKLGAGLTGDAAQVVRFIGIDDPAFRGGARAALGDVNGDGANDLVVGAGFGGSSRVAVFDGRSAGGGPVKLVPDFFAFEPGLRNGAFVAAGDVDGDGFADLALGAGTGGAPRVRVVSGQVLLTVENLIGLDPSLLRPPGLAGPSNERLWDLAHPIPPGLKLADLFAGDPALRGGVRVLLRDTDGGGTADLLTGSGEGEPSRVRVYRSANLLANPTPAPEQDLDPFGAVLADGVFVG